MGSGRVQGLSSGPAPGSDAPCPRMVVRAPVASRRPRHGMARVPVRFCTWTRSSEPPRGPKTPAPARRCNDPRRRTNVGLAFGYGCVATNTLPRSRTLEVRIAADGRRSAAKLFQINNLTRFLDSRQGGLALLIPGLQKGGSHTEQQSNRDGPRILFLCSSVALCVRSFAGAGSTHHRGETRAGPAFSRRPRSHHPSTDQSTSGDALRRPGRRRRGSTGSRRECPAAPRTGR